MSDFYFNCTWKYAGLISFGFTLHRMGYEQDYSFHLFVRRSHHQWGFSEIWYDGPYRSFGLGPLLFIAWS